MSKAEIKSIINNLPDDTRIITFTGGDPLERGDFFEIAEFASRKGIQTSISTAGPLARNKIKLMEKARINRVQFSLDGITPETHNGIRPPYNTYYETLEAIKQAIRSPNLRVSVCTTVRKQNFNEIIALYELVKSLGVEEYRLMRLMPVSQRCEEYDDVGVTMREYVSLVTKIVKRVVLDNEERSESIRIETDEPYFFLRTLEGTIDQKLLRYHPCDQGKAICAIAADGKITPCPIADGESCVAGDVRVGDLLDVWYESKVFKLFRDPFLIDGCQRCEYAKICGAGCRCAAFGYFGNLDAPDPICPLSIRNSIKYAGEISLAERIKQLRLMHDIVKSDIRCNL